MKRYWLAIASVFSFMLALFFVIEALHIPVLSDPSVALQRGDWLAAVTGVVLLIADVVLPVPSSLVMVAHGALFGVVTGTLLSLLGSVGATLTGYAIGRKSNRWLERFVSAEERLRADCVLSRWGAIAVVATRPLPLVAEIFSLLAGASRLSVRTITFAAIVGAFPSALVYAITGTVAASFKNSVAIFSLMMLVTGSFWFVGRMLNVKWRTKPKVGKIDKYSQTKTH
jgi:uncharacterized membrane protein YdjX (TVP38/TMEM64 family)